MNGVKTNVWNVEDIADALRVPASSIMKYLCTELGANQEKDSIVKGKHAYDIMLKQLDKYIHKYVLCKNCNYPELNRFMEGKDLKSKCNSCGNTGSHDALHKAGKEIVKQLKSGSKAVVDITHKDRVQNAQADEEEDKEEEVEVKKSKKEKKAEAAEVSDLDEELTWDSRRLNKLIGDLHKLKKDDLKDNEVIAQILEEGKNTYGLTYDFLHYAALAGLFPPKRNILKYWSANEKIFLGFVKQEGKVGIEHFMQALVLYFIRKYKGELDKYAQTFMKKLVDENILSEKFLIDWFEKVIRLDKDSKIYDKKAEKKFRDLIEKFVEWLKTASSDSGESSSEEEEETQEETK